MKNTARVIPARAVSAVSSAVLSITAGLVCTLSAATLHAQAPGENTVGYVVGGNSGLVAKGAFGVCWRAGYWTPAMAITECDPDLVPKPAPPAPPPPPPKPEAPKSPPPPPAPVVKTLTVAATDLFDFNKAVVTPQAKELIDREVIAKLSGFSQINVVLVGGHTDRLGSQQYNQKLSEKRAEAVKAYLVSKGMQADKIQATGYGKTSPVKFGCDDKLKRKELIACMAPNRRVVIEVSGVVKQ
jgi:OmpA-OmpF porin, OOP family